MKAYKIQLGTMSGGRLTRLVQAKTFASAAKAAEKVYKDERNCGYWTPSERRALHIASLEDIGNLENA